jgi:iron complex transport system substrate-binding protein
MLNKKKSLKTEIPFFVKMVCILLCFFLTGCLTSSKVTNTDEQTTVIDMAGREVKLSSNIERTIGIEAGALRLITYLQATELVVGVEDVEKTRLEKPYIIAHPELAKLPSIGPIHGGDAELIASMQPDVIFWTYTTAEDANDLQRKTGIPVIVLDYGDIEEKKDVFFASLRLAAKVLGKQARAEELIEYIENTISDLNSRTSIINEDKVYIGGVASRGSHGITSTEPTYAPFLFLNANNVCSKLGIDHAFIDPEKLLEWNPDKIFIDESGLELVKSDFSNSTAKYDSLYAYKEKQMYAVLPYNWYTTNYATVIANAYYIGKVLYPKDFEDINPEEKAGEIYEFFVGKDVYPEMKEIFGGFYRLEIQ